jgi:hypothetical protein
MPFLADSSGSEGGGLRVEMSVEIFLIQLNFWGFPQNMRVYDDFPIADESPDARCGAAIGFTVARDDHYGHESIIERRAASCGN